MKNKLITKLAWVFCASFALYLVSCSAATEESATCVTIEPGVTAEQMAAINARVGASKASLEPGNFEAILEKYKEHDGNVIPEQATAASADTMTVNGYQVLTLTPETVKNPDTVILYIHGGAYFFPMSTIHIQMVDELANRLGMKAYMPSYPLAANAQWEVAHNMVRQLYLQLTSEGKKVMLMGDSAGGGFALALAEWLHSNSQPMPERMVLLSPWLDVTMSNKDIPEYEKKDATLANYALLKCGQMWSGLEDYAAIRENTQVCPLYGDLSGMPPTLLFVGTAEVMYPDVTLLYEKLKAQHSPVRLVYGKDLFHVFPAYFKILDLPAANQAVDEMSEFMN